MRMKMVGVKEIFIKENKMCISFFQRFYKVNQNHEVFIR